MVSYKKRSCSERKSKSNPNAYTKEELVQIAISKGISNSKAQKSTKEELCKILKQRKSENKPVTKKSSFNNERPCGIRRSKKNPDAYSKDELVNLYVKKFDTKLYLAKKLTISQLCIQLQKDQKKTNKHKYTKNIEQLLNFSNKYYVNNLKNTFLALNELSEKVDNVCPTIDEITDNNIDIFFKNKEDFTNIKSMRQNTCFIRRILHSIQEEMYDYNIVSLDSKKFGLTFTPYQRIGTISIEGDTWLIGYKGSENKGYIGVLKYSKYNSDGDMSQNMLHEYVVGMILNNLRNFTPNFMYIYDGFYCSSIIDDNKQLTGLCSTDSYNNGTTITISEVCGPDSFAKILNTITDELFIYSIFLQIALSLCIAEETYKFIHCDLHTNNILIKELSFPKKLRYVLNNQEYFITTKYVAQIIDYGYSAITYNDKRLIMLDIDRKVENQHLFSIPTDYVVEGKFISGWDFFHMFLMLVSKNLNNNNIYSMKIIKDMKNYYRSLPGFDQKLEDKFSYYTQNREINNEKFLSSIKTYDLLSYLFKMNEHFNILEI